MDERGGPTSLPLSVLLKGPNRPHGHLVNLVPVKIVPLPGSPCAGRIKPRGNMIILIITIILLDVN